MRHGGPGNARRDASNLATAGEFSWVVPVIVFHGDRDTTVHPSNADHLLAHYTAAGGDDTSKSSPPVRVQRGQVPGGHVYTRAIHHDAGGRAIAERWIVHGLGHAWSGGSRPGSYTDPRGPDASAEMVRFFREHHRQVPSA